MKHNGMSPTCSPNVLQWRGTKHVILKCWSLPTRRYNVMTQMTTAVKILWWEAAMTISMQHGKPLTSDLPLFQRLQVKGTDNRDLLKCWIETDGYCLKEYGRIEKWDNTTKQANGQSPHGDTASEQWLAMESSYENTASVQRIVSSVVTSEAACVCRREQVIRTVTVDRLSSSELDSALRVGKCTCEWGTVFGTSVRAMSP
jgi:hypothetical protein